MRDQRTNEHDALLASLTSDEWASLAALASRQRMTGLLACRPPTQAPPDTRDAFATSARAYALRVLRYQAEFRRLAEALAPSGIRVMVLKGLHLASAVYAHPTMREMNDIDVLVLEEHLEAARNATTALGYTPLNDVEISSLKAVAHHLPLVYKPGVCLEVHWRLAPVGQTPLADPEGLWQRAEPSRLATNAWQLCPEDALLHICAHATLTHFFDQGLRPLCDVRALVARHGDQMDWDAVATRAGAWRCDRGLVLCLRLAEHLLGAEVPPRVFTRLATCLPSSEILSMAADLVVGGRSAADVSEAAGRLMRQGTVWDRIRYMGSRLMLTPDQLRVIYPTWAHNNVATWTLVPVLRVVDLTRRYAMKLARLAWTPDSDLRKHVDRRNTVVAWLRNE